MSRKKLLAILLPLALIIAGILAFGVPAQAQTHPTAVIVTDVQTVCPGTTTSQARGFSGITPTNTCTPSFTKDDMNAFFAKYGVNLGKIQVTGTPKLRTIRFVTASDADKLAGRPLRLAGNPIVCYTEFRGQFQVYGDGSPGLHTKPFNTVFLVFDAHTGNILLIGGAQK